MPDGYDSPVTKRSSAPLVLKAAAELSRAHLGIGSNLIDAHPVEALTMRSGHVDIASIFRPR